VTQLGVGGVAQLVVVSGSCFTDEFGVLALVGGEDCAFVSGVVGCRQLKGPPDGGLFMEAAFTVSSVNNGPVTVRMRMAISYRLELCEAPCRR
jgi:hypothetical protein